LIFLDNLVQKFAQCFYCISQDLSLPVDNDRAVEFEDLTIISNEDKPVIEGQTILSTQSGT
jgi:hypothetical protein